MGTALWDRWHGAWMDTAKRFLLNLGPIGRLTMCCCGGHTPHRNVPRGPGSGSELSPRCLG